jgi:uncharacterized protein YrrD
MTAKPIAIRYSEFLHCLVLDRNTTEELGRVELLWMYPQVHRILGFICKSGLLTNKRLAVSLPQIKTISNNTIWLQSPPTETDITKVNQLESLIGHQVWSESGTSFGKVIDCLFDLKTGNITQYLVALKGWKGVMSELYPLMPGHILSFGSKRVLVSETAAQELTNHQGRLQQTWQELKQDYRQVKGEVQTLSQQAKTAVGKTAQRTGNRFKTLQQKARQKAQELGEELGQQARQTQQTAKQVWQEEAQDWIHQAQTKGSDWVDQTVDQVREQATQFREQVWEPTMEKWDEDDWEPWSESGPRQDQVPTVDSQVSESWQQGETERWGDAWDDEWDSGPERGGGGDRQEVWDGWESGEQDHWEQEGKAASPKTTPPKTTPPKTPNQTVGQNMSQNIGESMGPANSKTENSGTQENVTQDKIDDFGIAEDFDPDEDPWL